MLVKIWINVREGGTVTRDVYNISLYERNVQVVGLRSVDAPILLDTIRTGNYWKFILKYLKLF